MLAHSLGALHPRLSANASATRWASLCFQCWRHKLHQAPKPRQALGGAPQYEGDGLCPVFRAGAQQLSWLHMSCMGSVCKFWGHTARLQQASFSARVSCVLSAKIAKGTSVTRSTCWHAASVRSRRQRTVLAGGKCNSLSQPGRYLSFRFSSGGCTCDYAYGRETRAVCSEH